MRDIHGSRRFGARACFLVARNTANIYSTNRPPSHDFSSGECRLKIAILEPISKSSEEDNEAGELDKAEEVLGVVLPPDENTALPLYPREEAFDEPAPHVTA